MIRRAEARSPEIATGEERSAESRERRNRPDEWKLFTEQRSQFSVTRGTLKIIGGIAQLGEHLLCKQGVIGSIPIISTKVVTSG